MKQQKEIGIERPANHILILALAVLFLVSSCTSAAEKPNLKELSERISAEAAKVESFSAKLTATTYYHGKGKDKEMMFYAKKPGLWRIEILSPPEMAGALMVSDGKTFTRYTPRTNSYAEADISRPEIRRLASSYVGFLSEYMNAKAGADLFANYILKPAGDENKTAGDVPRFKIVPKKKGKTQAFSSQEIWLDPDTLTPSRFILENLGGVIEKLDIKLDDVRINPKIPAGKFKLIKKSQK